jgi:hypothetical protein
MFSLVYAMYGKGSDVHVQTIMADGFTIPPSKFDRPSACYFEV